jgi:hypothetical protein
MPHINQHEHTFYLLLVKPFNKFERDGRGRKLKLNSKTQLMLAIRLTRRRFPDRAGTGWKTARDRPRQATQVALKTSRVSSRCRSKSLVRPLAVVRHYPLERGARGGTTELSRFVRGP